MKHNISCALVRDLAPLYAEHLVSEESRKELEAHLEACELCRAYYHRITENMEEDLMETARQETVEIDHNLYEADSGISENQCYFGRDCKLFIGSASARRAAGTVGVCDAERTE